MASADADIANKIGTTVSKYVSQYTSNNHLIADRFPQGLDQRTCRSYLMSFMAGVEKHVTLDVAHFRQYAMSCHRLYNSEEINDVYDALDDLNFSAEDDVDIQAAINTLHGFKFEGEDAVVFVSYLSIAIMCNNLGIEHTRIRRAAQAKGIPVEEVNDSAFGSMDACGKVTVAVGVVTSVVDVIFEVLDIVDVVEQSKAMCDKLDGPIKQCHKDNYDGMKKASIEYQAALAKKKASPAKYGCDVLSWIFFVITRSYFAM